MSTVIKSRIVKIGNSQGIRIPKLLLEQSNLGEEVELVLQEDQIVVRPIHYVRHGWEEAFKAMSEQGDDELLDGDALVYPYPKLKEILQYINEKMPYVDRIGTYATPKDILRRTVDELVELRNLKLGIIYMGIESGDAQHDRDGVVVRIDIPDSGRSRPLWPDRIRASGRYR